MKKRTAFLLLASGLLLASCASSSWSCCKRYVKTDKEKTRKADNPNQKPLV
ncbi:hypothetical protein [Flavobacterium pallidum]|uniref:hypothetical protein n=1 Tax=Flavobacterium pallidum TaxID=2172098 RepID=UPI0015E7EE95|nr:hypothetical protein [Flavobacterium pallidum]